MPRYSAELLGSGEKHEFKSVPSLLKFINAHRGSKGKRNVGPKGLKKILSGNGVFENVLRVKKILKGDSSKTTSTADAQVSKSPTSKAPIDGGEKPEKGLPFKTRRARQRKSDDKSEGPIADPKESIMTEKTVKAAVEKGNAGPVKEGEMMTVDTETPQVRKKQTTSRKRQIGLARGRLVQKFNAIYRSLRREKPVSSNSLFQAFESLKKSMATLGSASVALAASTAAAKNNIFDWKTFTTTLDEHVRKVEKENDRKLGLYLTNLNSLPLSLDDLRTTAISEVTQDGTPQNDALTPYLTAAVETDERQRGRDEEPETGNEGVPGLSENLGAEFELEAEEETKQAAEEDQPTLPPVQQLLQQYRQNYTGSNPDSSRSSLEQATGKRIGRTVFARILMNETVPLANAERELERLPNAGPLDTTATLDDLQDDLDGITVAAEKLQASLLTSNAYRTLTPEEVAAIDAGLPTTEGNGAMRVGGAPRLDETQDLDQDETMQEEAPQGDEANEPMMIPELPLNPDEPNLEELYPLSATNLENLGRNTVSNYHDLRKMLNSVQDVPTFLKTLREFGMKCFNRIHISNTLQAQLLEVAQAFRTEPAMYAKYIVHFAYFILKHKVNLKSSELRKVEMGLATKFQQFFGVRGEVEDNSITSHIRLMVNEAAGATVDMEPMVQQELVRGAGALDSLEAEMKTLTRTTDNMLMEKEVVARRRMHKSKRRGMVLYEPGKSNLSTQARLAPFKTPIDPELRRPLTEHRAPSQRVTSVPRISYVQPNRPQRVTIPQKVPTLVGDERPESFSRNGARQDLDRSDILNNTRNILNANLSQGAMYGRGSAVDQANLKRRTGITLYSDDKHERRAHKRLRASFTLNMWNET